MADLTNIIILDPNNFSSDSYTSSDEALLTSIIQSNEFNVDEDYVEFLVYDLNNNRIIPRGNDATFTNYTILDNEIYIDPEQDLINLGIDNGIVNVLYNFYKRRLGSSSQSTYYIKEISSDRTEIRLDSNIISKAEIINSVTNFISYRNSQEIFPDFYINLGSNQLYIANNILLDTDGTVLIKLYEPLPSNVDLKTSLWVVEKISEGLAYRVEFISNTNFKPQYLQLRGPNLNLQEKDEINNSTEEVSLSGFGSPSSQNEHQINSVLEDPSIEINVDYSDYSSFVNFSSAESRVRNFFSKVELIQSASAELTLQSVLTNNINTSASQAELSNIINDTITNFDGYEYYLYFESNSVSYPKSNTTPPYTNVAFDSVEGQTWVTSSILSAREYDEFNNNYLYYSIPQYIREDNNNAQYLTFIDMIGHYFDDYVWVYIKDTTNKYDADNRIDYGISKDLVAQTIRDFGVKLYQNNYSSTDLYSAFLGFTTSGSLFPYPYMTGSLPTPEGYEYVDTFISSSTSAVPLDDINKRIYKRIFHNLPYLLKKKGTVEGLKTLITLYGIPDTILHISEFGGKDRNNVNDWDLWNHQYDYAYQMEDSSYISSLFELSSEWQSRGDRPGTIQFRFNAGLAINAPASQSLWSLDDGTNVGLVLEYDTSLPTTLDPYSGSIINPEYQYADLKLTIDGFVSSASLHLPFYNNDWWSVQISRLNNEPNTWELRAANKIYSGSDGSSLGFIASSSFTTGDTSPWDTGTVSYFSSMDGNGIILGSSPYINFKGKYQEIRYFNTEISESVFQDYVMNPQSIEGNGINGSYNQLAFRASLGGELYTESISLHPKISGDYIVNSFVGSTSLFNIQNGYFVSNDEWVFFDSPAVGIKNRNSDKIKQNDLILPYSTNYPVIGAKLPLDTTLSNLRSIQQSSFVSQSYTNNLNLAEIAFSPQNEINDDIIKQIGYFNIGEYIGDPRLISSSLNTYPDLDNLRNEYFFKYIKNYDLTDFIRLIKFFDNSLFKMVKDFVPARTALASGIIIKQHILERQKYPQPQTEWERFEYTGSIGQTPSILDGERFYIPSSEYESIPLEEIEGGNGGAILITNITQSWNGIHITPSGSIPYTQDDEREFVNGEFSGSEYTVTNGELNPECDVYKEPGTELINYNIQHYTNNDEGQNYVSGAPSGWRLQINLNTFLSDAILGGIPVYTGGINLWWNSTRTFFTVDPGSLSPYPTGDYIQDTYKVEYVKISKTSTNGIDLADYIPSSNIIRIPSINTTTTLASTSGWANGSYVAFVNNSENYVELDVLNISEKADYYLLQVNQSDGLIFSIISQATISGLSTPTPVSASLNSNAQTVFNPFIPLTFANSDCNPLYGNVEIVTPSKIYYDLDYSQGAITPVNFNTIISGSASKATIQDYNYFVKRSTIPRYEGSKNTSFDYNVSDGAIDATQTYFAYFNWVGGTSPEWGNGLEDRSGVNVRFFIDENGNVIKPISDSQGINQGIVEQNFTEGKIATLAFDDSTGASAAFSNLLGNHTIFKSGKTITPIIYSQTESIASGSNGGYTTTLTFVQGDQQQSSAGDYRLTAFNQGDTIVTTGKIDYQNVTIQGAKATWTSDNTYSPQTTNPTADGVTLYFTATLKRVGGPVNKQVTFRWYKNGSPVGSPQSFDFNNPTYNSVSISYTDATAITSDNYDVRITAISGNGILELSTDSYFQVSQTPVPNIGNATSPFWETTATDNIIRTTTGFTTFYGQKQEDINGSGFFNIANDFELQVGDEIRFEGTETQAYVINEVWAGSGGKIHLRLDRDVTATNLQWFLVRRYVDDPASIILEVDKTAGGTSPGILKPQYLSRRVENNIDTILEKLKTDQLI